MEARFGGFCSAGRDRIAVGESIVRHERGWAHPGCLTRGTERYDGEDVPGGAAEDAWERRQEQQYRQGIADGERYQADRAIYGAALAERFQAQEEFDRYWKYGEDD